MALCRPSLSLLVVLMITCALGRAAAAPAGPSTSACSVAADCLYNGDCVDGACACDAGWHGDSCGLLNIAPAPVGGAYGYKPNVTSWGGKPVQDDSGLWHLYAAEIVGGCGLSAWGSNSRCIHATARAVGGPYTFSDVAVDVWCHGPEVTRSENGTYLLFHITSHLASPKNCTTPVDNAFDTGIRSNVQPANTALHFSSSPDGPWQPAYPAGLAGMGNPSPVVMPNGTITVVDQWATWQAPSWTGPWRQLGKVQWSGDGGPGCTQTSGGSWSCQGWEDPFLWYDHKRAVWKLITHVWPAWKPDEPACDHDYSVREAGYAYSFDAVTWVRSAIPPFDNKINRTDGTISVLSTRERPKLVFDSDGVPVALFNGVSGNPPPWGCKIKPGVDSTYTLYVPITKTMKH